jgi:hypothetical protein
VELVSQYETINQTLKSHASDAMKGNADELIQTSLDKVRYLYSTIQQNKNSNTKIHLKDAESFMQTSTFAAINARNIKFDDQLGIDKQDFLNNISSFLQNQHGSVDIDEDMEPEVNLDELNVGLVTEEDRFNENNWIKLGLLFQAVSRKSVVVDFLNGPLATEKKKLAPRKRNVDDTTSTITSTANQVQSTDLSVNHEQNTAHMVRDIYQQFVNKYNDDPINFFRFFINPNSYSQSVENLFFTSFLIKDSKLKLVCQDGIPMVSIVTIQEMEHLRGSSTGNNTIHQIASLDYSTWKKLITTFDITESFLRHRSGTEDTIPEDEVGELEDELQEEDRNLQESDDE